MSTAPQAADDKLSLPTQEQAARELCDRKGWQPVDVLIVDGHSRRYIDIRECARDMEAKGITAFTRLMQHWKDRDFDVLIVRDASRFARTQALHAYVVESTIDAGATLYSLQDGPIDETNYRMWTAMAGYAAASEMDRLRKLQKEAYRRAAARGLPLHRMPDTHRKVRDERGKTLKIEVVPEQRDIYTRAGELLLEGVSWSQLGNELATRFGIVSERTGKPHRMQNLHRRIYSPPFWGHVAVGIETDAYVRSRQPWMVDAAYRDEVPEDVTIHYNVIEPVLTGDFGAAVKSELVRRARTGRRKWRTDKPLMFSGLIVCGSCGYRMSGRIEQITRTIPWTSDKETVDYIYYRCIDSRRRQADCPNRKIIREDVLIEFVTGLLRRMLDAAHPSPADLMAGQDAPSTTARQVEFVEKNIADLESRIRRTILRQVETDDPALVASFNDVLQDLSAQKRQAEKARDQLLASIPSETDRRAFETTIETLRTTGLDQFWKEPPLKINQMLHRLFGPKRCILVDNGEILGFTESRYKKRKFKRSPR